MIYVFEPLCRKGGHESFNSGILYGLQGTYNDVCFYAEKTHIEYIKSYLQLRHCDNLDKITYHEINFPDNPFDFRQLLFYNRIFRIFLNKIKKNDKVLFLNATPMSLFVLHALHKKAEYKNIIFNIVLHNLEVFASSIKNKNQISKSVIRKSKSFPPLSRIYEMSFVELAKKSLLYFYNRIKKVLFRFQISLYSFFFNYKSFFSKDRDLSPFNFIVLSKHILNNLRIDNSTFKIKLCYHPCIFPAGTIDVKNDYPKFAIFGCGTYNGFFEDFLYELDILNPSKKYEIRLISTSGYYGIDKYKNITLNRRNYIPREECDKQAGDIDYFLNFYDSTQYRFTCSGSLIDAIMYRKPVIYIGNECYDSYNSLAGEIGIRAGDTKKFASIVFDIIENWPADLQRIREFKKNIEKVISIIDVSTQLKNDSSIIA